MVGVGGWGNYQNSLSMKGYAHTMFRAHTVFTTLKENKKRKDTVYQI